MSAGHNSFALIFDMDGVILDSERIYQQIEREMYTELGIPVSTEEHLQFMGTAEKSMWGYMREHYNLRPALEELICEERERFIRRLEGPGSIKLMDGILALLRSIRAENIPCWIASSSSREIIRKVLLIYRLGEYFRGFVSGEDVRKSKPAPDIFLKTASLAGLDPSGCLVIEDSVNGIRAARAAGMKVIALRHPDIDSPPLCEASLVVDSLMEINPGLIHRLLR